MARCRTTGHSVDGAMSSAPGSQSTTSSRSGFAGDSLSRFDDVRLRAKFGVVRHGFTGGRGSRQTESASAVMKRHGGNADTLMCYYT